MSKSERLQVLVDVAKNRTDVAASEFGRLSNQAKEASEKLALLESYRSHYLKQYQQAMRRGVSHSGWSNYQAFLGKLDAAIAAQRELLARAQHSKAAGQTTWISEKKRLDSFDTLLERSRQAEQQLAERIGRREEDEHALRLHLNRKREVQES